MKRWILCAAILAALCSVLSAQDKGQEESAFQVASIFTDHMVLQREASVPVWGWAEPGTKVTAVPSWDKKKYTATAASDGRWEMKVATPAAGGPYTLNLSAGKKERILLQDVMIGEVWLCSGQSNMALSMIGGTSQGVVGAFEQIAEAPEYADRIRFFDIKDGKAFEPQTSVKCKWERTDGAVTANVSAVGYLFAKRLTRSLGVPVGIIANPWGGCLLPPWMPVEYLEKYVKGQIPDEKYQAILDRRDAPDPDRNAPRQVGTMYNARMYPVKGYAIRGFVWYQGCSELIFNDIAYYDKLQAAMVRCWRDMWGDTEDKLPFYFTLLAPYGYSHPEGEGRGYFVENQLASLDIIPNSGVAVTETLGDIGCIHPGRKQEVADQFAVLALERVYGVGTGLGNGAFAHPDWVSFPADSPVEVRKIHQSGYDLDIRKSDRADDTIVLHFVDTRIGLGHYSDYGFPVKGFEVAGADRVFHPVPALANLDNIVIDCSGIEGPVAVRYAFHNWCEADLQTALGIPVASFRTDDWPMTSK